MWAWIIGGVVGSIVLVFVLLIVLMLLRRRAARNQIVSVVLLRRSPRGLTEADVRGAVRRAFGKDVTVTLMPEAPDNVRMFMVMAESMSPLAVIDSHRAYMTPEEAVETAKNLEHPAARSAMVEHKAWVSVDAMGLTSTDQGEVAAAHTVLAKLAAEFYDDACLLLYLPARERIAQPGPEVEAKLREGQVAELFGDEGLHAPMIHVENDDADIERAMAEAARRLPEFLEACRKPTKVPNLFKGRFAVEGGNEYIWLSLVSMGEGTLTGTIENEPVGKGIPAKGQPATVAHADVVDWIYINAAGKPEGMFVDRILMARQAKGRAR